MLTFCDRILDLLHYPRGANTHEPLAFPETFITTPRSNTENFLQGCLLVKPKPVSDSYKVPSSEDYFTLLMPLLG